MTETDDAAAPFGIAHLRELPDTAISGGFDETMEARFADDALGSEQIGASLQRIKPGRRLAFAHRHQDDEEIYAVVAGTGRALVQDRVVELGPWDVLRIRPGAGHTFQADGDGLEMLVIRRRNSADEGELVELRWPDPPGP